MALAPKGRRTENRNFEKDTHFRDTIPPESAEQGMLINQDQIIDIFLATLAKLDADTGVTDTDYADLAAKLEKLKLM